jgi:hypothetical protein
MVQKIQVILLILAVSILGSCEHEREYESNFENTEGLHKGMKVITDVMVSDVFSPPVASRNYMYAAVAAYETIVHQFEEYSSLAGQLAELEPAPKPEGHNNYDWELAATVAMLKVGKTVTFDEKLFEQLELSVYQQFSKRNIPDEVYKRSVTYGQQVADHILKWASGDNYAQTRTYPRYTSQRGVSDWSPTPPAYFDAIEPSWREIRTLVLESADQFIPDPPTPFSIDPQSQFYSEAMEVYTALLEGDEEEKREIAAFWDCNPFAMNAIGHLMVGEKKISPGGHWMNIATLASRKANADLMQSAEALAITSIALFEGFIVCWDEKYRSKLLRPETYINRYIDDTWIPALQSPPFPEHTSGHSVISTAAATALTKVFGDNFEFDDTTQLEFDLPIRSFTSFLEAAEEAAISRLYGGIHFMPAIDSGVEQGARVGSLVVEKISTRKSG